MHEWTAHESLGIVKLVMEAGDNKALHWEVKLEGKLLLQTKHIDKGGHLETDVAASRNGNINDIVAIAGRGAVVVEAITLGRINLSGTAKAAKLSTTATTTAETVEVSTVKVATTTATTTVIVVSVATATVSLDFVGAKEGFNAMLNRTPAPANLGIHGQQSIEATDANKMSTGHKRHTGIVHFANRALHICSERVLAINGVNVLGG